MACLKEVAAAHQIGDPGTDSDAKDTVKKLFLSLCFGGSYEGWMHNVNLKPEQRKGRCVFVSQFEAELKLLRQAVFTSREWGPHVAKDRARLRKQGRKKDEDAIDRSVMARVAQAIENQILTSMRRHCAEHGIRVLSLVFDGLAVLACSPDDLKLREMEQRIQEETGYVMGVEEKPLFLPRSEPFPVIRRRFD